MTLLGPQMLKDFLLADDSNSCSSNGFRSFPRSLLQLDLIKTDRKNGMPINLISRSRSKAASTMTTTTSAIHRASETVFKYLSFSSVVKSPLVLPRSISRKLSKRRSWNKRRNEDVKEVSVTVVTIKDILRWKSFRDLIEETPPPLNFSSSPQRCTTTTTTESISCSWCDSDFTAEDSPSWSSHYDEDSDTGVSKNRSPEDITGDSTTMYPKEELWLEENEHQLSPVSVLNFPFQEDEPIKLEDDENNSKEGGNELEGKTRRLMNHVRAVSSSVESCEVHLLLDFFTHELGISRNPKIDDDDDDQFDCEVLKVAKDWISRKYEESFGWEEESKREAYVRDMERGVRWSKFEEEQEELAMEIEARLLNQLVDELVVDVSFL